jgi:hypothetical protein
VADSALLASLLMGQRRKADPNENLRAQGQNLIVKGTSTAPVQSPLEGLARALQAGIGGFTSGLADQRAEERSQKTVGSLSALLQANPGTPEFVAAMKGLQGDPETLAPIIGQMLANKMALADKNQAATNQYTAAGGVIPGAQPQTATPAMAPPLPQGQPSPSGFNNNTGNIRATNLPWEGKGAPQNGFETFGTPQQGVNAHFGNLQAYVKANPNITVAQAIAKWAPPNENDTDLYIKQVAEGTGINPGMPLAEVIQDPAVGAMMLDAMTRKEKGGLPQGVNADTFMNATGGNAQQPGQPLTVNMTPQGSADGAAPQPQAAPPAAPQQPQVSPQAAELSKQAQAAFQAGDPTRAAALQQKAQEAQAAYVGQLDTEQRGQTAKAPQQRLDNAAKFRDDFQASPIVKNYREVVPIMASMDAALTRPNKAADLNLIYGLGKIMDPNSVVREGELALAKSTGTLGDELKNLYAKVNGGSGMTQETRARLVAEARSRFGQLQTNYEAYKGQFKGLAERAGIDPRDVIVEGAPAHGPIASPFGSILDEARDAIAKGAPREQVIERLRAKGVPPEALQ